MVETVPSIAGRRTSIAYHIVLYRYAYARHHLRHSTARARYGTFPLRRHDMLGTPSAACSCHCITRLHAAAARHSALTCCLLPAAHARLALPPPAAATSPTRYRMAGTRRDGTAGHHAHHTRTLTSQTSA